MVRDVNKALREPGDSSPGGLVEDAVDGQRVGRAELVGHVVVGVPTSSRTLVENQ